MLTPSQLRQIMPSLAEARVATFLPPLNQAMQRFAVNSVLRAAAFVAQLAHESGEFKWMEELWGPTAAQRRYEGRADLGNMQPGDGKRFTGRGPIQITGRANYKKYGSLLGVDLIASPERAASPDIAFLVAGLYWASNHLNELADGEQFVAITKRINGGTNGLSDRQMYYERAKRALVGGTFGDAAPATRGMPPPRGDEEAPAPMPSLDDLVPLARGAEALREAESEPAAARRRPAAKKRAAVKAPARKAAAKQPAAKKASAKAPAKKTAVKKAPAGKTAAKKAGAGKAASKASAAKKAGPAGRAKPG